MKTALLALALVAQGCLSDLEVNPAWTVEPPPRAAEATAIAQARLGGDSWLPVVWYGGAALESCSETSGSFERDQDFQSPTGCRSGITGANVSIIGWDGVQPVSWTALVHELAHQRFGDGDHTIGAIWGNHGRDNYVAGTVVGDISLELLDLGM